MVVRNKLMEEFGEDTYNRCKRKVQIHMEQLAGKYDEMAGVEKVCLYTSLFVAVFFSFFSVIERTAKSHTMLSREHC